MNPLPFEHMEPKRFEDLVRQLLYDFKVWRNLEATGRSGGDAGFDARGIEAFPTLGSEDEADAGGDDLETKDPGTRLWLIQCKRERDNQRSFRTTR